MSLVAWLDAEAAASRGPPATTQPFGATPTELHLTPGDFNSPNNSGTIRSVYLSQAGGCSMESPYAELFGKIDQGPPVLPRHPGTVMATSGAHLARWRCVPFSSSVDRSNACVNPHHGRCEMIVPVKRLNYRPQAAEGVLFDRLDELNNPALALFYASFMTDAPPLGHVDFTRTDWFTKICTSRRAPLVDADIDLTNFYTESWAFKNGGPATCPSSETPAGPCAIDCDTNACVQPICTQGNTTGCTPPATNPTNGQCQ